MYLFDDHKKMLLEDSGIDQNVAEARGYRTIEKKMELQGVGLSKAQRTVPALDVDAVGTFPIQESVGPEVGLW
jgi:hypothetical protein